VSARSVDDIEAWLLGRLRERLGPDAEDVDAHLPFSYYGLDSLDAVGLATDLEEWLGFPVTPDIAWDHPTAHAVAAYLGTPLDHAVEVGIADETLDTLLSELDAT
jgi:acyl carrier protein